MSAPAPTSYPEGPRHGQVTPDNHGDILLVVAWFLMVVMILATSLRLLIRFTTTHVPGIDDVVVSLAMLTGVGATVAISLSVDSGLGRRISALIPSQILRVEKDLYVTTILYLITLALAKTSTLLLLSRLAAIQFHLLLIRAVGAIVLLWTIGSVFAVAFQCGVPRPWDYTQGKCFNPIVFWDIIGVFDILTELALIALPTLVVWNLHMKWQRKLVVVSAFTFRLVTIGIAIARLVLIRRLNGSSDLTWDALGYAIVTQCQTTLSVVIACIPALKPYMDRAESGFMAVSLEKRPGGTGYAYGGNSFHMQSMKSNGIVQASKTNASQKGTKRGTRTKTTAQGPFRPDTFDHSAAITSGRHDREFASGDDDRSSEDGAGSEKYIIQRTQAWNVSYEEEGQQQQHSQQNPQTRVSNEIVHAVSSI